MVKVSCLATIEMHKMVDCEQHSEAYEHVKQRLKAAALQVVLDLRRDGFIVDVEVVYRTAMKDGGCVPVSNSEKE